jgi:4-hydroxyphenylpyruvate dioxygenase
MQIALSAASLPEAGLTEVLATAGGAGYGAVELFRQCTESNLVHPEYSMQRIRDSLATANVELAACEIRPLTGRKADSDERNLAYNLRQLEWDIHLCRALGVSTLGFRGGANTAEARQDLAEGASQLAEKITDVTLAIGPRAGSCLATAEDIDALLPALTDQVGLLLDTSQLLIAGVDPVIVSHAWAPRVRLVYLCDVLKGATVGLGEGDLDVAGVLTALIRSGYTGPVVVETPVDTFEAARKLVSAAIA